METVISPEWVRVDAIIDRWGANAEFAVEMLQDVQGSFRHLPKAALERIAESTGADLGRLYHIATFFKSFSLEPRGEIAIQVCTGLACHVKGSARVLEAFSRQLEVQPGGTTRDLKYSLDGVRCGGDDQRRRPRRHGLVQGRQDDPALSQDPRGRGEGCRRRGGRPCLGSRSRASTPRQSRRGGGTTATGPRS